MQEVVKKINEKLNTSGWETLSPFLNSIDFINILNKLKDKIEIDKQRFCPSLGKAFRFLEMCHLEKIKVVIIIDCISNDIIQCNGIPLSVSTYNNDTTPFIVFNSIKTRSKVTDVEKWLRQGVLLLPLALTTRVDGQPHKKIWQPFIIRVLEVLNRTQKNSPYILMGKDCWQYVDDIISDNVRKVDLTTPITDITWSDWVNEILQQQSKTPINW